MWYLCTHVSRQFGSTFIHTPVQLINSFRIITIFLHELQLLNGLWFAWGFTSGWLERLVHYWWFKNDYSEVGGMAYWSQPANFSSEMQEQFFIGRTGFSPLFLLSPPAPFLSPFPSHISLFLSYSCLLEVGLMLPHSFPSHSLPYSISSPPFF